MYEVTCGRGTGNLEFSIKTVSIYLRRVGIFILHIIHNFMIVKSHISCSFKKLNEH